MLFPNRTPHVFIIIGLMMALAACTNNPTPGAKQDSPPATNTPLLKTQTAIPSNAISPTATMMPPTPTPTPTPTPKPSLEDILLTDARHVQGVDDAPVTFIEFSDFK